MSRKIILIKQELLLLVYELNRSGLLAENEKIRPILAQLEKLLLCDLSPSRSEERRVGKECRFRWSPYHEKKNGEDQQRRLAGDLHRLIRRGDGGTPPLHGWGPLAQGSDAREGVSHPTVRRAGRHPANLIREP